MVALLLAEQGRAAEERCLSTRPVCLTRRCLLCPLSTACLSAAAIMRARTLLLLLSLAALVCLSLATPSSAASRREKIGRYNARVGLKFLEAKGREEGVTTLDSGVRYRVLESGGGSLRPSSSDSVKVHYRGTLISGEEFDSSYARGQPATFGVTQGQKQAHRAKQELSREVEEGGTVRHCLALHRCGQSLTRLCSTLPRCLVPVLSSALLVFACLCAYVLPPSLQ